MNDALDVLHRAKAEKSAHEVALAEVTPGTDSGDTGACRRILKGAEVDDEIGPLSTGDTIAVALSFGRLDLLLEYYNNFRDPWQRLDTRQRRLVDTVARATWRHCCLGTMRKVSEAVRLEALHKTEEHYRRTAPWGPGSDGVLA